MGDGTTLVVAPLAAELGMQVVKLSGHGLGHTGGTLDKLDAIPGMRTELSGEELIDQVEAIGLAVCAQTADLVPADKAMYGLRDVTATVDNIALIASSVMSKKLAGGAEAILLDVKTGSGAFMESHEAALELAELCVALGDEAGRATGALITDMGQPLAESVGNASEVHEAIDVLRGERSGRFTDLCIDLAGHMAVLAGVGRRPRGGRRVGPRGAGERRRPSSASAGSWKPRAATRASSRTRRCCPSRRFAARCVPGAAGWLESVDAEAIGHAAARLGAGRLRKGDEIDLAVGIHVLVRIGDEVDDDSLVAEVLANDDDAAEAAERDLRDALSWSDTQVEAPKLVHEVVGERLRR